MSACYQNAWLLIHGMATPIITFRERPCIPAQAVAALTRRHCGSVRVACDKGIILDCYPDGTIQETLPQGDTTIFPAKPTYAAFLRGSYTSAEFYQGYLIFQTHEHRNYFEFHSDGSVVYRKNACTFLWSRDFPVSELQGTIFYSPCDFDDQPDDESLCERSDSYS